MANSLIAHNVNREPRILAPVAANGEGDVRIRHFQTVQAEAQAVVADIQERIAAGVQPGDIIVLSQRKTFAIPIVTYGPLDV
jgi:DNA helicase II / ATP-dependent DNA helicase PcrA